ncbi:MAG: DUF1622 domain-containing protein [Oscillatoriales cyanobacterium C42_A2020_001]|nr:DUF1622 domain-containing protein [Leptolyngbyaceae cyanobacterium C42_A2020_001]
MMQIGEMATVGVSSEQKVGLAAWLEELLTQFAQLLEIALETIAILVVAIAVVIAVRRLFHHKTKGRSHHLQEEIRLEFGQTLALSLEFQLAADIVATAVSPSWEDVAKLGAIAGIRTFLNFFLQREVRELQAITEESEEERREEGR